MSINARPPDTFWCNDCDAWMPIDDEEYARVAACSGDGTGDVICKRCGNTFVCGDCGWEITRSGECERDSDGGGHCPGGDDASSEVK